MLDALPYIIFVVGATLAALGLLGGAVATHALTRWRGTSLLTLFPYCMMLASAAAVLLAGRDVGAMLYNVGSVAERHPVSVWLTRFNSVFLMLTSLHLLVWRVFSKEGVGSRMPLLLAFIVLWATTVLSPAVLGAHRLFSHEYIYCLIIGIGLVLLGQRSGHRLVCDARDAILISVVLALVLAPIRPAWVLDVGYSKGLIPGLPRFAGFAAHPVAMGLIVTVGLLCWQSRKYQRQWLNVVAGGVFLTGLLLAQSKTSWLAAALAYGAMRLTFDQRRLFTDPWSPSSRSAWLVVLGLLVALLLLMLGLTVTGVAAEIMSRFTGSSAGGELMSLTGRDRIWAVAMGEWRANAVFGYGPALFDPEYRASIGMLFATHGHNEFIDTLARTGAVGATGLVVYYAVVTVLAMRVAVASRGLSVALWVLVSLLCVSEVPLQLFRYGPEALPHFLLLGVVASHLPSRLHRPQFAVTLPMTFNRSLAR